MRESSRASSRTILHVDLDAFFAAVAAWGRSNQNPMSRYEHSPTSSQPTNSTSRFAPSTSTSIEATNRLRTAK
ncbi:MAG: hypothetical protein C4303_05330 [candidate division GAL15 bacterium]